MRVGNIESFLFNAHIFNVGHDSINHGPKEFKEETIMAVDLMNLKSNLKELHQRFETLGGYL